MPEPKPSMLKFRKENKRYDYYPTQATGAAIERLQKANPDAPTRHIIDTLVVAGIKAMAPMSAGQQINGSTKEQ